MSQVVVTQPSILELNTGNSPGEKDWTVVNDKLHNVLTRSAIPHCLVLKTGGPQPPPVRPPPPHGRLVMLCSCQSKDAYADRSPSASLRILTSCHLLGLGEMGASTCQLVLGRMLQKLSWMLGIPL
jgi:hypothetical protein